MRDGRARRRAVLGAASWTSAALCLVGLAAADVPARGVVARVEGAGVRVEFDGALRTRIVAVAPGGPLVLGPFASSETARSGGVTLSSFVFAGEREEPIDDALGRGHRTIVRGATASLDKTVAVTVYDEFPRVAVFDVRYENRSKATIVVDGWTNNAVALSAVSAAPPEPAFWAYLSGSYESRPDWVRPLKIGFAQSNFQGMNASDYGGGTPVVDVWRRDVGVAVGHLALAPKLVSLPVARHRAGLATAAVRMERRTTLRPGEALQTLRTFVIVHRGDHFDALSTYRRMMARQGVEAPSAPPSAFDPIWCAWGYGREFTPEQVGATLPLAKRLGFGWATLDDGWQVAEGDWVPVAGKFPKGDEDMRALVDRIHAEGLKAQLWWAPLAADPGSRTHKDHPEQLLLDARGAPRKITWWDSWYLCPAFEAVREDAAAFVRKALTVWGFDGLKIDGQHLNGAPPCFNKAHAHPEPEASVEGVPGFFKAIYSAAQTEKPGALVEICPCGTAYSFFTMPYLNMAVASDPESSWQVRLKGKTLKALLGDRVAYFGDHVEMSEGGEDFASTLGVGGVVGSNFAWPGAPGKKDPKLLLTPAREKAWEFWVSLYKSKKLSEGEYLGDLYDIGFDRPETHAIRKDGRIHYAFFAPTWKGAIDLRGLDARRYRVRDYEKGVDLGVVEGPSAKLTVSFRQHLLLEASPE